MHGVRPSLMRVTPNMLGYWYRVNGVLASGNFCRGDVPADIPVHGYFGPSDAARCASNKQQKDTTNKSSLMSTTTVDTQTTRTYVLSPSVKQIF